MSDRAVRTKRWPIVALAAGVLLLVVACVFWFRSAPNAGLAVVVENDRTDLCYVAVNAQRIVVFGPLDRDVSARASDCIAWPKANASGTLTNFAVEVTGSFGRKTTVVADARVAAAPALRRTGPSAEPTAAVEPSAPASASLQAPAVSDRVERVRTYYSYWNLRKYPDMWKLLSPAFQKRTTYDAWLKLHTFDKSISVTSARQVAARQVAVTVISVHDDGNGKDTNGTYHVTWNLVSENGRWLLDGTAP